MTKAYSYIRFSTPDQLKGDSLRRQLEASERYAKEKGLLLDTSLKLRDLGISAFSGAHRKHGALGQFLALVENGEIEKGSVLIVESLDRLSREQVLPALNQFMSILQAGITIVTSSDGMEYTEDGVNSSFSQLMMSLMVMSRAHEESAIKSQRLSEAWKNKRAQIKSGKKLTGQCPAWLKLSDDKMSFVVIPERARVIQRIYELKLAGNGATRIERMLNEEFKDVWLPKNGWRKSYIMKILKTPAVIGEYQPHHMVNGKRTPVGDPVVDYFPPVIDVDTFYAVQETLKGNKTRGGKTGKIKNLFSHIAKCGFCGGSMQFVDKGDGNRYLVCDKARRGVDCEFHSIRYDEVETLILKYCHQLRVEELFKDDRQQIRIKKYNKKLIARQSQLESHELKSKNLINHLAESSDVRVRDVIDQKLQVLLSETDELKAGISEIQRRVNKLNSARAGAKSDVENLNQLVSQVQNRSGDDVQFRLRLRESIRRIIRKVEIYPVGRRNRDTELIDMVDPSQDGQKEFRELVKEHMGNKQYRRLRVWYLDGSFQSFRPAGAKQLVVDINRQGEIAQPDTYRRVNLTR